jgi:hypothetical protein
MKVKNLVAASISITVIVVWLLLAAAIIYRALVDPLVLENIEGLLTCLAVLSLPAMKIIDGIVEGVIKQWHTSD